MLIFQDDRLGGYVAKIADFGYSTRFARDNALIDIAESRPWTAPEHHWRKRYNPSDARKTDVFSFGMLCLWLLFESEFCGMTHTAPATPKSKETLPNIRRLFETEGRKIDFIQELKADDKLLKIASQLITSSAEASASQKIALERFFSLTLASDPLKRASDLSGLLCLLSPDKLSLP